MSFLGLENKVAIVTGGSRGIGRSVVASLAKQGVRVAFCYASDESAAREVVAETETLGCRAEAFKLNVNDASSAKSWVDQIVNSFGSIDFLVNNAGITKDKALLLMSEDDWNSVIDTNLNGLFMVTREVAKHLFKQKSGAIVNVSSTSGLKGTAGQTNYCASKAGIIGFTRALSKELSPYGVRVNCVAPGFIRTDMIKNIPDIKMQEYEKFIPMKRLGAVDEVSDPILFLLSNKASYITGQVIAIDGGLTA